MLFSKVNSLKKVSKVVISFGSAAIILSSQIVEAKDLVACHDCHMRRLPKAKELPLYDKERDFVSEYDKNSTLPLISEISIVRRKLFQYASYVNMIQEQAVNFYETGIAHSKGTFDYLKDEENKVQRILIIVSGGLAGLLFARKRGIIKKVLYTSVGTGVTFSAFYPSISKEYALTGWNSSKDKINNVLTKYGGYNTDEIAEDVNTKVEYIKSSMKFEKLMNILNEKFHKKASKEEKISSKETNNDQDMYTTRSAP